MSTLQVLISTMNQVDHSLLDRMNIQSDAIVVNQCERNEIETFTYKGNTIKWISMTERGVGLSRNICLLNATADIILFADEDIVYQDGYTGEVISAFSSSPLADVICFNINLKNSSKNIGKHRNNKRIKKLHFYNTLRYGATLIGARRKALIRERVYFSTIFGGGAEFSSGEDSLFLKDCLKARLKIYSGTYFLGDVDDSTSSWFMGINEKLLVDRGRLYSLMFKRVSTPVFIFYAFKLRKKGMRYGMHDIYRMFREGQKAMETYR